MAWLQSSPVHVDEYLAIAGLARDLEAAATQPRFRSSRCSRVRARETGSGHAGFDRHVGNAPATARPRSSRVWSLAAAAALALVALTTLWSMRDGERFGLPRTYTTAHGEQSDQRLPDGSVLHLNTDSQVTVHYSRRERVVDLDRGQALFQVAHEAERGFRVAAGNAKIVAVGTQFDVYRRPDAVLVTVVEGTVAVYYGPPSPLSVEPATDGRRLPGRSGDADGCAAPVDAHAAVAWLKRQIAFEDEPLGEVAAEFNRYGTTGSRSTTNCSAPCESAVSLTRMIPTLSQLSGDAQGVVVQKTPTRIRVRSIARPPGSSMPVRSRITRHLRRSRRWNDQRNFFVSSASTDNADAEERARATLGVAPVNSMGRVLLTRDLFGGWIGTAVSAPSLSADHRPAAAGSRTRRFRSSNRAAAGLRLANRGPAHVQRRAGRPASDRGARRSYSKAPASALSS